MERSPEKYPHLLDALRMHGVEVLDDGLRLVPKGKRSPQCAVAQVRGATCTKSRPGKRKGPWPVGPFL